MSDTRINQHLPYLYGTTCNINWLNAPEPKTGYKEATCRGNKTGVDHNRHYKLGKVPRAALLIGQDAREGF